jgi:hypothetical protein
MGEVGVESSKFRVRIRGVAAQTELRFAIGSDPSELATQNFEIKAVLEAWNS